MQYPIMYHHPVQKDGREKQKIVISATDISMIVSHSKIIWRYLQRVMHVIVESINVSH